MKNNLFQKIDIKTIPSQGIKLNLCAIDKELQALSERFCVPNVKKLCLKGRVYGRDILCFEGHVDAEVTRECVQTLELFDEVLSFDFKELFSENGIDFSEETNFDVDMDDTDVVELIKQGHLDIGEIVAQQFGLNLEPFPKKNNQFYDYFEDNGIRENPFAVLKKLIKK